MEPDPKRAKVEAPTVGAAGVVTDAPAEAPAAKIDELETDDAPDTSARIKDPVLFCPDDTTLNVMQTPQSSMLMPLSDGGFQYLLAGARANVGLKGGRYMFEVKIVECMNPYDEPQYRQRAPPRNVLRIGFTVANHAWGSLFMGEGEENICFDADGGILFNKTRTPGSPKFATGDVLAVVLNLNPSSTNFNTLSLFRNGVRACPPHPLPDCLKGKALYPTITFKSVTLHYNFGPRPLTDLPFKCRMIKDASAKDVAVKPAPETPKDGRYEVLFPVVLPDEGGFDWADVFLERNQQYVELSDRVILSWAEKSGVTRPKGYSMRACNDKPEMGFGLPTLDDLSVRRVLQAVAPLQQRHFLVLEVKGNLVKEERREALTRWPAHSYKRSAVVLLGEPPQTIKQRGQESMLKQKQEAVDTEFRTKQAEEKRRKFLEKRQRQLERERRKAERKQKKLQDEIKKRQEEEKRRRELGDKAANDEAAKVEVKEPEEEEEEKEEEEEPELPDEEPPKVSLTPEEKKLWFKKPVVPDLVPYVMNTSFTRFSLPEKEEGFDDVRFDWQKQDKAKEYMKSWIQARKLTSRIEDLQPSDWFNNKFKDWQKVVQTWHTVLSDWKAKVAQKATAAAAKLKAQEAGKEPEAEAEEPMEEKVDFENLDVFGVEDVADVGGGEPLFSQFTFDDWTMLSLRFELHLLIHAFRKDVSDPDRIGIHLEHLPFYYNKYYKKALNQKFFGVEQIREVVDFVQDTVAVNAKNQVLEAQLPDGLESYNIFVMLTEECRRERCRRVDLGDESAKLKLTQSQANVAPTLPGTQPQQATQMARPPFQQGGGPQMGWQQGWYQSYTPPAWRAFGMN